MSYKILLGIPAMGNSVIRDMKISDDQSDPWLDFEVGYINGYYYLEFESYIGFDTEDGCRNWIISCLAEFTRYMDDHHYDMSKEISLYDAFTEGVNVNTHFETLEDAYAFMKMMVFGFHGQGLF